MGWYIQIERSNIPEYNDTQWEPIVIGAFPTEDAALKHLNDSLDVEDWVTAEAKAKQYNVDDAFVTEVPDIPSYGVNTPVYS